MVEYASMNAAQLQQELSSLMQVYQDYQQMKLSLNMSRGRPAKEQMELSQGMLSCITPEDMTLENGTDVRNYGVLEGIPEARRLMGELMGVSAEEVIVCGSSSLNIMYDLVSHAYTHGVYGGSKPWSKQENPKFLCPTPGYDRHFGITEYFGIEMINIPMTPTGPDMDLVEKYVNTDPTVKGIWCVPKYSNPQGITYSDETVRRFAALKPAADDFRIFWDNAYAVHDLYEDDQDHLLNLIEECKKMGSEDMVYEFFSTSKISFAGGGMAALAASVNNIHHLSKQFSVQTIGWNKLNMLMHVKFFKNREGVLNHMKKHAAILRPKFHAVLDTLDQEVTGIASWNAPKGGYFISFDTMEGCAKRVVQLCKEAGVVLTGAGATYPYGKDPKDCNIRIAPSSVSVDELKLATTLFCLCVKIATVEKRLEK